MVANPIKDKAHAKWIGPARVTEVFPNDTHHYRIKFLVPTSGGHRDSIYHSSQLRFFDYASMRVSRELLRQAEFYAQQRVKALEILDFRITGRLYELQVLWETQESTWEPLIKISQDLPELVEDFVDNRFPPHSQQHLREVRRILRLPA